VTRSKQDSREREKSDSERERKCEGEKELLPIGGVFGVIGTTRVSCRGSILGVTGRTRVCIRCGDFIDNGCTKGDGTASVFSLFGGGLSIAACPVYAQIPSQIHYQQNK